MRYLPTWNFQIYASHIVGKYFYVFFQNPHIFSPVQSLLSHIFLPERIGAVTLKINKTFSKSNDFYKTHILYSSILQTEDNFHIKKRVLSKQVERNRLGLDGKPNQKFHLHLQKRTAFRTLFLYLHLILLRVYFFHVEYKNILMQYSTL